MLTPSMFIALCKHNKSVANQVCLHRESTVVEFSTVQAGFQGTVVHALSPEDQPGQHQVDV